MLSHARIVAMSRDALQMQNFQCNQDARRNVRLPAPVFAAAPSASKTISRFVGNALLAIVRRTPPS
jgi:hypothetical protein